MLSDYFGGKDASCCWLLYLLFEWWLHFFMSVCVLWSHSGVMVLSCCLHLYSQCGGIERVPMCDSCVCVLWPEYPQLTVVSCLLYEWLIFTISPYRGDNINDKGSFTVIVQHSVVQQHSPAASFSYRWLSIVYLSCVTLHGRRWCA